MASPLLDYKGIFRVGHLRDVDTATVPEDVWDAGGVYVFPAALQEAADIDVQSNSTDDAAAGTGARTLLIRGLDADYMEQEETVTLNGVTPIHLTGDYIRFFDARVVTVGTGEVNAGDVNVYVPTATTGAITGVTTAAPPVVTDVAHGLSTGDKVRITGTGGTTEINDRVYSITRAGADTFSLDGMTTTNAYTTGGTWTQVANYARVPAGEGRSQMAIYTIPADYPESYLLKWYANLTSLIVSKTRIAFQIRDYGEGWRYRLIVGGTQATSPFEYELAIPFAIPAKADIRLRVLGVSADDTDVSAGFELLLGPK